ncbi:MAG: hypothetical protein K0V04_19740 [Deltaproteobacteria bacterium]|nr:hypothetical protein [Deltaproteobacteria bacterium]
MKIIETCPAFDCRVVHPAPPSHSVACVADPLHAIAGSWLGPMIEPAVGADGPAPRLDGVVRCDDHGWR